MPQVNGFLAFSSGTARCSLESMKSGRGTVSGEGSGGVLAGLRDGEGRGGVLSIFGTHDGGRKTILVGYAFYLLMMSVYINWQSDVAMILKSQVVAM